MSRRPSSERPASANRRPLRQRAGRVLGNARDRLLRPQVISQAGQTPYEIIADDGLVTLRRYRPLTVDSIQAGSETVAVAQQRQRVPVVIVPPLAVNMLIYDLFPTRSLVKYLLARGFEVYLIDWGTPGKQHAHYNLHTYVVELMPALLAKVRQHSGEQDLSLHGWSMGGILALCYGGVMNDPHIRNLVVLGAPVNSHASGTLGKMYQFVSRRAEWVREHTGFRIHKLNPRLLYTPGWVNAVGFKLTNPVGTVMGYWDLLKKLGDRDFIVESATNATFLNRMVAYTGGIVQDMMVRIWIDNEMADGVMPVGDRTADLKQIGSNLLAFAGTSDTMVTKDAVITLLDLVGSEDRSFHVVPGGHMGILSGSKAPQTAWKLTADWLATRSQ
ncbi:MAG: putative enzyme [Moraxellaceae bacterium]|jgi:polyhydroxyalkanoate synthase|nr:putative enzyme [Moraxellaceae bacterium]